MNNAFIYFSTMAVICTMPCHTPQTKNETFIKQNLLMYLSSQIDSTTFSIMDWNELRIEERRGTFGKWSVNLTDTTLTSSTLNKTVCFRCRVSSGKSPLAYHYNPPLLKGMESSGGSDYITRFDTLLLLQCKEQRFADSILKYLNELRDKPDK